ncbi:hypothetical protein [Ramlibacter albus]|uniref:Twin-arginine translocation signal domain-containing protein n=1 Tax=Ramlibacter albus TaxID=2079448 RepID=A0A923S0L6_9BURK|nr:hypothetical protein [Ramlibacter albus]MBC5763385.1 hypothetical protein [Ramlibacter albus]
MQRRSLLKLGVAGAAVLALGGGAAALLQPGVVDSRLSPAAREVFAAVGRGVLDGTLPQDATDRARAIDSLLPRIDALVAGLPPHAQAELSQLLALLAMAPGRRALAGLATNWRDASVGELQAALQDMRMSSLAMRQQAYHALHDIVSGAYFSDASTWGAMGYPGPVAV